MARLARIDYPGAIHHVILRGIARGRILDDEYDRKTFVDQVGLLLPQTGTECLAWSLLPNHAHLLLRTGSSTLARVMQRLLTRHAARYNLRHDRVGHLFQNRYKSILCADDAYFLTLVRYIHLNPLRAGLVDSPSKLDRYPWCGHPALMGLQHVPWQNTTEVLMRFAGQTVKARELYRSFLLDGFRAPVANSIDAGMHVKAGRHPATQDTPPETPSSDPRILGGGPAIARVMQTMAEADRRRERNFRGVSPDAIILAAARVSGVPPKDLRHPNKRHDAVVGRALACKWLVEDLGMRGVQVAALLGISGAAVSQAVDRGRALEVSQAIDLQRILRT